MIQRQKIRGHLIHNEYAPLQATTDLINNLKVTKEDTHVSQTLDLKQRTYGGDMGIILLDFLLFTE